MANIKCPKCGKATMESSVVPEFKTKFEGVEIQVENAKISRCPNCAETSYSARELKRWRGIKNKLLESTNQLPTAGDVKRVRTALSLNISEFADLLGVTRQTIHAWERAESGSMKFGPAAGLIRLLDDEIKGSEDGVSSRLLAFAHQRQQLLGVQLIESDEEKMSPYIHPGRQAAHYELNQKT